MTLCATILGCGSSAGVPRIGNDWGHCNPAEPKNRRSRCSLMVERAGAGGVTRLLIDTSPDLRAQMLAAEVAQINGVWFSHAHADHLHGIDDLRGFYLNGRRRIPVWADARTSRIIKERFGYCFETPAGSSYPPILDHHLLHPGEVLTLSGAGGEIAGLPFMVRHGDIDALGFRFGGMAYTPDLNGVPDESLSHLAGLDLWIIDALKRGRHPSHFSLEESLRWIERMKPARAILTNMHIDLDYAALKAELPPHVIPAYDGMVIPL